MKNILTATAIALILVMAAIVLLYFADQNRMSAGKPVIFTTWGAKYAPSEELPESDESALSDIESLAEANSKSVVTSEAICGYPKAEAADDWGITLTAENISSTGITLVFTHNGKTQGEFSFGEQYTLEKLEDGKWKTVEYLPQEYEICWNAIAYIIPPNGSASHDIALEWLYGMLEEGVCYRVGSEVMNFYGTGNYETKMYYTEFAIIN